jgi:hypothetical protein
MAVTSVVARGHTTVPAVLSLTCVGASGLPGGGAVTRVTSPGSLDAH